MSDNSCEPLGNFILATKKKKRIVHERRGSRRESGVEQKLPRESSIQTKSNECSFIFLLPCVTLLITHFDGTGLLESIPKPEERLRI